MKRNHVRTCVVALLALGGGCGDPSYDPYGEEYEPPEYDPGAYEPGQWEDDRSPGFEDPLDDDAAPVPNPFEPTQGPEVDAGPDPIDDASLPASGYLPEPTLVIDEPILIEGEIARRGPATTFPRASDSPFDETKRIVSEAEIRIVADPIRPGAVAVPGLDISIASEDDDERSTVIRLPERFVMASVPGHTPGLLYPTLETRVSPNGRDWSAPAYPLTVDCNIPVPIDSNIAPGIAATSSHYLVAAYGIDGRLWFAKSANGVEWAPAMSSFFTEPDLTSESRPSVVYDYDDDIWYALAIRRSGRSYTADFLDLDGHTSAFSRVPLLRLTSTRSPSIAHTGVEGARYIVAHSGGNGAAQTRFRFYDAIPFDEGGGSDPSYSQGLDFATGGSNAVSSSLGQIFAATSRSVGPAALGTGINRIWQYDPNTEQWSELFQLADAEVDIDHEGPSLAGVLSNMVVASPGTSGATDVWHVEQDTLGVLRPVSQRVDTRSIKPVGLAFGPREGDPNLVEACSEKGSEPLQIARLRFRSFKRTLLPGVGDFDTSEDVMLKVTHETQTGYVDRSRVLAYVIGATKNQSHAFNENDRTRDLPSITLLVQPGEVVVVTLDGDGDPTTAELSYDELVAPATGGNAKNTHTYYADGSYGYQLSYDASVTPAQ
jgi:hypothetical protein